MRIPRRDQLLENDITHTMWRGHNRERIFKNNNKQLYLELLSEEVDNSDVVLHSFCIMNNHNHLMNQVRTVDGYSRLFHRVHSKFAQRYNKQERRCGAVATGRPKSVVVQDQEHLINAMFYVDANPVRAGIVKHPKHYRWGSYNYYAYGRREPGHPAVTAPQWYLQLGKTPIERQRAYRRLFDAYLRSDGLLPKPGMTSGYYMGDSRWVEKRRRSLRFPPPTTSTVQWWDSG